MRRTRLGAHPNEGARKAWAAMRQRGLSQAKLRLLVRERTGRVMDSALLVKLLYCDRRPGVQWAEVLRQVLDIDPGEWYRAPRHPFAPPAKRQRKKTSP